MMIAINASNLSVRCLVMLLAVTFAASACSKDPEPSENNNAEPAADMKAPELEPDLPAEPDAGPDVDMKVDEDIPEEDMAAPMEDVLAIPGLSSPVKARLDDIGVLYIECETNNDCFAAQGYMHAKHRLFAMDLIRRQTRGQLAGAIGSLGLDADKSFRHIMTTRDGTPLEDAYLAQLDDETVAMLQAYSDGVNAFIRDAREDRNGAKLSEEFDFPLLSSKIPEWTPKDSIAVYMQLSYQLGETADEDLFRAQLLDALGPEVAADLYTVRTGTTASVYGSAGLAAVSQARRPAPPRALPSSIGERISPASRALGSARQKLAHATSWVMGEKYHAQGSNNWVLSPGQTAGNNALLANDPHLSINNPAIWYYVVIDSKSSGAGDIHVAGASVPAVPGIVIGHNGKVAWGTTTARFDMSDVYIETLNEDGTAVIFNGEEVPLLQKDFTFEVHNGADVTETFEWVPHHGPLLSKDVENRRGVAVRWVAHEAGPDINFVLQFMRSGSVDEASRALQNLRALNQSWVLADTTGKIAWYPHSWIPKRPWASPEIPNWIALPGDGSAEWDGFLMGDQIPHVFDPPSGLVVTANGDMDGSFTDGDPTNDGHTPWQYRPVQGFRMQRIIDLLAAGGQAHTPESAIEIQGDDYMLYAEQMVPAVLAAIDADDTLVSDETTAKVIESLRQWNYTCPTGLDGIDPEAAAPTQDAAVLNEAVGCAVFHVLITNLATKLFADELAAVPDYDVRGDWYLLQRSVHQVIVQPESTIRGDAYFDDIETDDVTETRAVTIHAALVAAGEELVELFETSDAEAWLWGRIHGVTLASFFAEAGIESYNDGPYAMPGGFETVNPAPPNRFGGFDGDYGTRYGASLRVVMELDPAGVKAWYQLPGGQIHLRDDPRYQGLLEDWLSNKARDLPYTLDDVIAAQAELFEFQPAQ